MKICNNCAQTISEQIILCPACGNNLGKGIQQIDDYRILEIVHEGYATILFKALQINETKPVMLRLFTARSGVDDAVAQRLRNEIVELKKLPQQGFVNHQEIKLSSTGLWYRISEWVESISWGDLMVSGRLKDFSASFDLFHKIAQYLSVLHDKGHTIPYLILNDIMVIRTDTDEIDVKIDYKMSRYLDPSKSKPGPMLSTLINRHPDLRENRSLNNKSDIWALGKIFIEILTADYHIRDYIEKIDELALPHHIKVFLKSMLADDPEMRPGSVKEIADKLKKIKGYNFNDFARSCGWKAPSPKTGTVKKSKLSWIAFFSVIALMVSIAGFFLVISKLKKTDDETLLFQYANKYADAVAFVTVSYWIESANNIMYRNSTEGTAFLVDKAGYLLTNRHVACPWLEDRSLMYVINRLKEDSIPLVFQYKIYLWFEGQKAFYQSLEQVSNEDPMDKYFLHSAYRSDGHPAVSIAGVARVPDKTGSLINSPLKDDFAVLKIEDVPDHLKPLPLDINMDSGKISRLYPVITLGFPLGSQTQASSVNVSVTRGHVRRSFESMLQVDSSIHKGNSGGPIIDARGLVIGIASGVATMKAAGPLPISTPLSDIGMVLPIDKAVTFLNQIKRGAIKWNGILDVTLDKKIGRITRLALENRWKTAEELSEQNLSSSVQPTLFLISAMMHYCNGDFDAARDRFHQFLSLDEDNYLSVFMLFLMDWIENKNEYSLYENKLLLLNWRSNAEFLGYLAKILVGKISEEEAEHGWETLSEKSWIYYIRSLIHIKNGEYFEAEELLRVSSRNATNDDWCILLARAQLVMLQKLRSRRIVSVTLRDKYLEKVHQFWNRLDREYETKRIRLEQKNLKLAQLSRRDIDTDVKLTLLRDIMDSDVQDSTVRANLAFYHAMNDDWSGALSHARKYLNKKGRESAFRLRIGLLEAELLNKLGKKNDADAAIEAFQGRTQDNWYNSIGKSLLEEQFRLEVVAAARENPENMLTAHMALGLWAEGSNMSSLALRHYKAALESYLDDWMEYDFAKERIRALKLDIIGRTGEGNDVSDIGNTSEHH